MRKFCSFAKSIDIALKDVGAKPFSEMPGPIGIFGIGNFYKYFKIFGKKYSLLELHHNGMKNYEEFGSIVHERFYPGIEIVHLFDPDDIKTVYTSDGPSNLPQRLSHHALVKYRTDRPETYRNAGLIPTNGEEWWKIRSQAQKDISAPKSVRNVLSSVDQIVKDFTSITLPSNVDENGMIFDMEEELLFLNFEMLGTIIFGERFDALSKSARDRNNFAWKTVRTVEKLNEITLPLDREILWRFFDTPKYKEFIKTNEYLEKLSGEIIKKKLESGVNNGSIIEQLLQRPGLDLKDVNGLAVDMFIAGIDTTSSTTSMTLYHVTNNQRVQDLIYQEACKVLPNPDDPISINAINTEIPYIRAVLKESLRINPISIGVGRLSNSDMVLGGYVVPKNTILVTGNFVLCRQEKYFHDPLKFIPERWLNDEKKKIHPYLVLPFGHGMRSCIARRFAEQNMLVTLLRIFRNYKVEWHGTSEPLDVETKLINYPKDKIILKFIKR